MIISTLTSETAGTYIVYTKGRGKLMFAERHYLTCVLFNSGIAFVGQDFEEWEFSDDYTFTGRRDLAARQLPRRSANPVA